MTIVNVVFLLPSLLIAFVHFDCIFAHERDPPDKETLVLAQIVYRHGDRSSFSTYPLNPVDVNTAWPEGMGQLTKVGMRQQYAFGQFLRERYVTGEPFRLLNETYRRWQFDARSSNTDRTLMSAYSNLAGLFPPDVTQKWSDDIAWQPIPVHTRTVASDYELDTDSPCPRADLMLSQAFQSEAIVKEERKNAAFYRHLANKTGNAKEDIHTVSTLDDILICLGLHNHSAPTWVAEPWGKTTMRRMISTLHTLQFSTVVNGSTAYNRLRGGPLVKLMIDNMKASSVVNASLPEGKRVKFHMFSAHDTTVGCLLSALGVYAGEMPGYTAAVIVELFHSSSGGYTVVVSQRKDLTNRITPLLIPGCANVECGLDEFVRATKSTVPDDMASECKITSGLAGHKDVLLISASSLLAVLVFVVIVAFVFVRRRRRATDRLYAYSGIQQIS